MLQISEMDIKRRIERDNPWWGSEGFAIPEEKYKRRAYFSSFKALALNFDVQRAAVLLGPRRVGKTVMVRQLIHEAISSGINRNNILYASIDSPMYSGISLTKFVDILHEQSQDGQKIVIFDEIQYLMNWEVHLKDLVDSSKDIKFIVTGSAAAALRLKSKESGAGRFSEFMLPPLTFYEFLCFMNENDELIDESSDSILGYRAKDIEKLNARFIDYLNFGGYPEAVLNQEVRKNQEQFIMNDIIDKVLLKDLPSLYGIDDIPELNRLFLFLAYNTGLEASLEKISKGSGVSKPTIKKYIEYLESAFLIMKISRVDENSRHLSKETTFKVYLNNPSMRAAAFEPVSDADSERIGYLAESAVFSQWQHAPAFRNLRYGRWKNRQCEGEVDVVFLSGPDNRPQWIGEVKWSDVIETNFSSASKSIEYFIRKHKNIRSAFFTSRTYYSAANICGVNLKIYPTALYCYAVGRNITKALGSGLGLRELDS